jgi:hypothetical protein
MLFTVRRPLEELRDDDRLVRVDAAFFIKKSPFTLQAWAYRGIGPPFQREGRDATYRVGDLRPLRDASKAG